MRKTFASGLIALFPAILAPAALFNLGMMLGAFNEASENDNE